MSNYPPNPNDPDVWEFISQTLGEDAIGSFYDDFKRALEVSVSSTTTQTMDDLFKAYITTSLAFEFVGNAIRGYSDNFRFVPGEDPPDTTPDAYNLIPPLSGLLPTTTYIVGNVVVSGIEAAVPVSTTNCTLQINSDPTEYTDTRFVQNGDYLTFRARTGFLGTTTNATVNIGGVVRSTSLTVIPAAADLIPDDFDLPVYTNVEPNTQILSPEITLTGFDGPSPCRAYSITDGLIFDSTIAAMRINGGTWDWPPEGEDWKRVVDGDVVQFRVLSPSNFETNRTVSFSISLLSVDMSVTTRAAVAPTFDTPILKFRPSTDEGQVGGTVSYNLYYVASSGVKTWGAQDKIDLTPIPIALSAAPINAEGKREIDLRILPFYAGLTGGTYDVGVTALDSSGNESDFLAIEDGIFNLNEPVPPANTPIMSFTVAADEGDPGGTVAYRLRWVESSGTKTWGSGDLALPFQTINLADTTLVSTTRTVDLRGLDFHTNLTGGTYDVLLTAVDAVGNESVLTASAEDINLAR